MAKINVVTPTNIGKTIKKDEATKKFEVNVDNSTITVNPQGQLVAQQSPANITQVTQLASSQLFVQNHSGDFKYTELHEKPSFASGLGNFLISEITGWEDIELKGLGLDRINLWKKNYVSSFPFNDVHVLQLNCEVYEISDNLSESKGWNIKLPTQDKELTITKTDNNRTDVSVNLKLSLQEEKDVKRKYRIFHQIRVAERNVDSNTNTDFTVVKPTPKDPVVGTRQPSTYAPTIGSVNPGEPRVSNPTVTIMSPEDNHVDA